MYMKYLRITVFFFALGTIFLSSTPVHAQLSDQPVELINPIGGIDSSVKEKRQGETDVNKIIGNIIKVAMGILGSVTLVVFMYGGFLWLTSRGSSEKIREGLDVMLYAAIGIFIIFSSYAILSTILDALK